MKVELLIEPTCDEPVAQIKTNLLTPIIETAIEVLEKDDFCIDE